MGLYHVEEWHKKLSIISCHRCLLSECNSQCATKQNRKWWINQKSWERKQHLLKIKYYPCIGWFSYMLDFNGFYACVGSWQIVTKFRKIAIAQSPTWAPFSEWHSGNFLQIGFHSQREICARLWIECVQKILLRKQTPCKTEMTCWIFMGKENSNFFLDFTKI